MLLPQGLDMLAWKTRLALHGLVKSLPTVSGSGQAQFKQFTMFIFPGGWDPGPATAPCVEPPATRCPICHIHGCVGAAPVAGPAQHSLAHTAGAKTPLCSSTTAHKHGPSPTSKCCPLFPLTLLSFQMHYWEACKPRWLQPPGAESDSSCMLQSAPSLPCAALSSALTTFLETQSYRLTCAFRSGFLPPKMKAVVGGISLELNFTA